MLFDSLRHGCLVYFRTEVLASIEVLAKTIAFEVFFGVITIP